MVKQEKNENQNQRKNSRVLLILCTVIIVLLIAIVVLLLKGRNDTNVISEETISSPKRNVVINEENAEEMAEEILNREKVAAPRTYEVTMNSTWNFQDGASSSDNAYVENSTANTTPVYFDLLLDETEEVIYESPVIPVGSYLEDIKLDTDLDAGTYDCTLIYHLVDAEQNTLATLQMAVTVVVAN